MCAIPHPIETFSHGGAKMCWLKTLAIVGGGVIETVRAFHEQSLQLITPQGSFSNQTFSAVRSHMHAQLIATDRLQCTHQPASNRNGANAADP